MNPQELEKSLRYVVNEALKSRMHPVMVKATLDIIGLDLYMDMRVVQEPPAIIPAGKIDLRNGGKPESS